MWINQFNTQRSRQRGLARNPADLEERKALWLRHKRFEGRRDLREELSWGIKALVAQLVEHLYEVRKVRGSIPRESLLYICYFI